MTRVLCLDGGYLVGRAVFHDIADNGVIVPVGSTDIADDRAARRLPGSLARRRKHGAS